MFEALKVHLTAGAAAGAPYEEMAKRLGISQPTLARLENADLNTTLKTLTQLCRALRCRPGDLFEPGGVKMPSRRGR